MAFPESEAEFDSAEYSAVTDPKSEMDRLYFIIARDNDATCTVYKFMTMRCPKKNDHKNLKKL